MTTLQEAARKAGRHQWHGIVNRLSPPYALAQQELPQKERPDFMAGYDAGMADAKRMAQQGARENCPQPEICGSKECEFCRDTAAPVAQTKGNPRAHSTTRSARPSQAPPYRLCMRKQTSSCATRRSSPVSAPNPPASVVPCWVLPTPTHATL